MRARQQPAAIVLIAAALWCGVAAQTALPNAPTSVKFAVIGDSGSGERPQFEVADEMMRRRAAFPFAYVIMMGDNIYGGQGPADLDAKFAKPYKALLDAGVKFYAALGNHDSQTNRNYPLWNMNNERYYTWSVKNVRFFVIDSDKLDKPQLDWLTKSLKDSHDDWKICYFHHPLYSDGATHGSAVDLRVVLEPMFIAGGVNAVFSGHDHIYERITPQKGIYYFVEGAAGELRKGDAIPSPMMAAGFDQDQTFMLVEIAGDVMNFQAISRGGKIVDSGALPRQVHQ